MSEPDDRGGLLWRGVLGLVLVGAALGNGYNVMQRAAGPHRGLAWIKQEVKLASLESMAEAATVDSGASGSAAEAAPTATAATGSAAHPRTARDTRARAKGVTPAVTRKGTAAPAAHAPAAPAAPSGTAATPAPTATAIPSVPDTREPLEAQYPSIKKLWDAGVATFVDARSPEEYAAGHIPGALSMPFDDVFKNPDKARTLTHGRPIVVTYCGGGECDLSRNLAFSLIEAGHRKVLVFLGGLPGWKEAGNAVVTGTSPGTAP